MTLNASASDILVVRHGESEQHNISSNCSTNAGDTKNIPPKPLDAYTKRRLKKLEGLVIAICGDIAHSRVARSNIHLLATMGAEAEGSTPRTIPQWKVW